MELSLYRDEALAIEPRALRAETYNLGHVLWGNSPEGVVFLPIRSMQFLVILDAQEWVFVDGMKKHVIELAWQKFHPQARSAIDEAVPYDAVFYTEASLELMPRLESAVHAALTEAVKQIRPERRGGVVLPFKR
ncbi:MAG: hypothetical protein B7Y07_00680 [Halothiobacillus sp. 24-54-40]|jgi:hypothetical protein|nr:MAG: hypothetical protein B7Y58_00715 [Halothiobacillus sp. 35-54-62]OYZ88217.1 MAG: hypothetical protein B7Y07_00680 [Halothiobacillus sp. 24-54-40]OZA80671.1 MAG: hypothetical protein B7X64_04760 [Halothiobacillus sp. 39-53-45]HQS01879.1 hypothetical protein [Halothiobacillus sp.]HQS28707.1 hypothetical protein [Halothiobacillus sp.]